MRLLILQALFIPLLAAGQSSSELKIERWMDKKGIELNNPQPPVGFTKMEDCFSRPMYKRISGDTIFLISWGGSTAEDLKTFKKSVKDPFFNVFRYPSEVQSNETVVVTRLSLETFIWRDDTLYMLDKYNDAKMKAILKVMDDFFNKRISEKEFKSRYASIDDKDYPYTPRFKVVYFDGIFANDSSYTFTAQENFREETVTLLDSYREGEGNLMVINLDTHGAGLYTFSSDMSVIYSAYCRNK